MHAEPISGSTIRKRRRTRALSKQWRELNRSRVRFLKAPSPASSVSDNRHWTGHMASIRLTGDMKQKDFGERLQASQSARQAMMAKFRQRPGPDDPAVSERRLARAAVSAAREGRLADRETKRLAEEAELATVREAQAADQVAQERARGGREGGKRCQARDGAQGCPGCSLCCPQGTEIAVPDPAYPAARRLTDAP